MWAEREHFEVLEHMHYVCFHMEFEHDPVDPDEPCAVPGCPVLPATADDVERCLTLAYDGMGACLALLVPYTEPYDYAEDITIGAHMCLSDAFELVQTAVAYVTAARQNAAAAVPQQGQPLLHQPEEYDLLDEDLALSPHAAVLAWMAVRERGDSDEARFHREFGAIAAAITGPPPRDGEDGVPLPVPAKGLWHLVDSARLGATQLAVDADNLGCGAAVAHYKRAAEALRRAQSRVRGVVLAQREYDQRRLRARYTARTAGQQPTPVGADHDPQNQLEEGDR